MVVQGKYRVEIVYADTKKSFLEHQHKKTGEIYCEVEPDAEYFVLVAANTDDNVVANITIDGEEMDLDVGGLNENNYHDPHFWGISSRDEYGGWTERAFKFKRSPNLPVNEENKGIPPEMWTGSVEVSFHEAIAYVDSISHTRGAFHSSWEGNNGKVGYMKGKSNPDKKKGVMSAAGSTTVYTAPQHHHHHTMGPSINYRAGRLIKTVKLNYCSTLGLILAGILPKPPLWTYQRMLAPAPQNDHADKTDANGVIDLSSEKTTLPSPSTTATASPGLAATNTKSARQQLRPGAVISPQAEKPKEQGERAKKRRKLELKKKRIEEDVIFLSKIKDDSQEDMDEYIKAKSLHREIRNQIDTLQDEDE